MIIKPEIGGNLLSIDGLPIVTGDLLYGNGTRSFTRLASVAVASYLRSGGVTTAPVWSTLKLPNAATANRVAYATSTDTWGESANLQFDGSVLYIGGASSPISTELLSIQKDQNAGTRLIIRNNTSGTGAFSNFSLFSNAGAFNFNSLSSAWTTSGINVAGAAVLNTTNSGGLNIGTIASTQMSFWTNSTEVARFLATGEFLVGATTATAAGVSIEAVKDQNALTYIRIRNGTSGTAAQCAVLLHTQGAGAGGLYAQSDAFTTSGMFIQDGFTLTSPSTASGGLAVGTVGTNPLSFWTNNTERSRFLSTGEFLVGATALISSEFSLFRKDQNAASLIRVHNETSGTAAKSMLMLSNSAANLTAELYSAGFTTSGMNVADAAALRANTPAGLNVGTFSNTQASLWTNNLKRVIVPAAGGLAVGNGTAALATNATDGFLYIPTCAGTPTGVPSAITGTVAMVFDTTNNKLYIYDGAWLGGTTPGAFT